MDRRNFIKGTFGGLTAGGIILATPDVSELVKAIEKGAPMVANPIPAMRPGITVGDFLYDQTGNIVAVIHEIRVTQHNNEVTMAHDTTRQHIGGLMSADIHAMSYGPAFVQTWMNHRG